MNDKIMFAFQKGTSVIVLDSKKRTILKKQSSTLVNYNSDYVSLYENGDKYKIKIYDAKGYLVDTIDITSSSY